MRTDDTIVALASAPGPSPRAIVRLSGPDASQSLSTEAAPAGAHRRLLRVGTLDICVWLLVFRAPRSSTGQDVYEVHLPGNPCLVGRLLEQCIARGARAAEPGEFTARAFLNDRLDLTAAEGVAATIDASSRSELNAAHRLLSGELASRLRPIREALADLLALVEAGIDFTDQDIAFISDERLRARLDTIAASLQTLRIESGRADRVEREPRVVLVGLPNAGKSTLLNALTGCERAVTSPLAGTTRDAIETRLKLPGGWVILTDLAGLEDHEPRDDIERQMRDRSLAAIASADLMVLVRDGTTSRTVSGHVRQPDLLVINKVDLGAPAVSPGTLAISALTGLGIEQVRDGLDRLAFGTRATDSGSTLALNARHRAHLRAACDAVEQAQACTGRASELIAHHLRQSLDEIGAVVGEVTSDDVLGRVFSQFCIGK
jgi:tRNA modification GTPase